MVHTDAIGGARPKPRPFIEPTVYVHSGPPCCCPPPPDRQHVLRPATHVAGRFLRFQLRRPGARMTRAQIKEPGITDVDLDRARGHVQHGTRQFRDFLHTGGSELTLGFARWLKDRNQRMANVDRSRKRGATVNRSVVQKLASEFHVPVRDAERAVYEAVDSILADADIPHKEFLVESRARITLFRASLGL